MNITFTDAERPLLINGLGLAETATDTEIADAAALRLINPTEASGPTAVRTRDQVIAAAVADGRIPPSRADHWKGRWDKDPEATRKIVAKLYAVPDSLRASEEPLPEEGYPPEWLAPDERPRQRVTMAD